jgi:hypothetical protein
MPFRPFFFLEHQKESKRKKKEINLFCSSFDFFLLLLLVAEEKQKRRKKSEDGSVRIFLHTLAFLLFFSFLSLSVSQSLCFQPRNENSCTKNGAVSFVLSLFVLKFFEAGFDRAF